MLSELTRTGEIDAIIGTSGSIKKKKSRSQWPHGLRRGSAADRLLGFRVRIPPGIHECLCVVSASG